jgi:hypothetical protein
MDQKQLCGQCVHFNPIKLPTATGTLRTTHQAHCLAKSTYASNKPGNPVYPPGAKTAELTYAQHQITIVYAEQNEPNCLLFKRRA